MSIECGECERDLRGSHDPSCSRFVMLVCPHCARRLIYGDAEMLCPQHGAVEAREMVDFRDLIATRAALAVAQAEVAALIADMESFKSIANDESARAATAEAALAEARDEGRREGLEAAAKVAIAQTEVPPQHNIKDQWRADIGQEVCIAIRALIGGDGNV